MVSRNFTDDAQDLVSLHISKGVGPDLLVEIRRTSTARDVRDALVSLSLALESSGRSANGLCLIADSRLSLSRLQSELKQFQQIVRPDISSRLYIASVKAGKSSYIDGVLPPHALDYVDALTDAVQAEVGGTNTTRVTRQQVKAVLIERALCRLPPMTLAELRRQTGASHPTASAALEELQMLNVVNAQRDGPIQLLGLDPMVLRRLANEHALARKRVLFVDPTGSAMQPSAMANRVLALRAKGRAGGVALAGVIGAARYFPNLNITSAPRLDLSVFDGDTRIAALVDAGLLKVDELSRKPALVLHLQRDCRPPELVSQEPELAARLDCLADLEELGFQAEADEFAYALLKL